MPPPIRSAGGDDGGDFVVHSPWEKALVRQESAASQPRRNTSGGTIDVSTLRGHDFHRYIVQQEELARARAKMFKKRGYLADLAEQARVVANALVGSGERSRAHEEARRNIRRFRADAERLEGITSRSLVCW